MFRLTIDTAESQNTTPAAPATTRAGLLRPPAAFQCNQRSKSVIVTSTSEAADQKPWSFASIQESIRVLESIFLLPMKQPKNTSSPAVILALITAYACGVLDIPKQLTTPGSRSSFGSITPANGEAPAPVRFFIDIDEDVSTAIDQQLTPRKPLPLCLEIDTAAEPVAAPAVSVTTRAELQPAAIFKFQYNRRSKSVIITSAFQQGLFFPVIFTPSVSEESPAVIDQQLTPPSPR